MKTVSRAFALVLLLVPSIALAHTGAGAHEHNFLDGFLHPLGGLDHVLAMVAVGLLAAHLDGRALWLVPTAFIAAMIFGGWLGFAGVKLPYVETAIALSVVVLGALVALRANLPLAAAMALAAGFAVFHGYVHGAELLGSTTALPFGAGFVMATAILHMIGIALGLSASALASGSRVIQAAGGATAVAGILFVAGVL
jgi:urease accessory protein